MDLTAEKLVKGILSEGDDKVKNLINTSISYQPASYTQSKQILSRFGYRFPENLYQTHQFLATVSEICGVPYYLLSMNDATEDGLSGPFLCLDLLQRSLGNKSISCNSSGVLINTFNDMCVRANQNAITGNKFSISDIELCSSIQELLDLKIDAYDPGPGLKEVMDRHDKHVHFGRSAIISQDLTYNIHDAYMYNRRLNSHAGIYHDEYAEDTTFYRSIVDYLCHGLGDHLCEAYVKYIEFNDVSRDDGASYVYLRDADDSVKSAINQDDLEFIQEEYVLFDVNDISFTEWGMREGYSVTPLGQVWDTNKFGFFLKKGW